jgi:hypothetical protein
MIKPDYIRSIFISHFKEFQYPLLNEPFVEICNIQPGQPKDNFLEYAQGFNRVGLENQTYGELATLYEKWFQSELTSMVGLFHYRRFLVFDPDLLDGSEVSNKFWEGNFRNTWNSRFQIINDQINTIPIFDNKLALPLPRSVNQDQSIWSDFVVAHPNLENLLKLVCKEWEIRFPQSNIEEWLKTNKTMYLFNIFYGPKKFAQDWCDSIFPILIDIDNSLSLSEKKIFSRWAGYVSERVFSFYVQQKSIIQEYEKVHLPIIHFRELEHEAKIANLEFQLNSAELEITSFVNSNSWKITQPIRSVSKLIKRWLGKSHQF